MFVPVPGLQTDGWGSFPQARETLPPRPARPQLCPARLQGPPSHLSVPSVYTGRANVREESSTDMQLLHICLEKQFRCHGSLPEIWLGPEQNLQEVRVGITFSGSMLGLAAFCEHLAVAQALIAAGACVDGLDGDDRCPLQYAVERGCSDIALFLVESGATLSRDHIGSTTLHLITRSEASSDMPKFTGFVKLLSAGTVSAHHGPVRQFRLRHPLLCHIFRRHVSSS